MKNSLDCFSNRIEQTERRIRELKDKLIEIIPSEEQKEKKNEEKSTAPERHMRHYQVY